MSQQFRAQLASLRTTPSRSEDADDVTRLMFEAHDIDIDPLRVLLRKDVFLMVSLAPAALSPLEEAINANGGSSERPPPFPAAGRRRRGTRANATEDE